MLLSEVILMKEYVIADEDSFSDISPIFVGDEECAPGHKFGPAVREYYLIHFCLSGHGVLRDRYGEHDIEAGELFIIRPGEVTFYHADMEDPWHYLWIAFTGKMAEKFNTGRSVYSFPSEIAKRLSSLIEREDPHAERYISVIYDLMCELIFDDAEATEEEDKLHKLRKYIKYNYMHTLRVESLAAGCGFERSYLYRIFKARYGMSVKDYITKARMENAKKLLTEGYTVAETARLVGYEDEFNFSKAFKKYHGASPSRIRDSAKT